MGKHAVSNKVFRGNKKDCGLAGIDYGGAMASMGQLNPITPSPIFNPLPQDNYEIPKKKSSVSNMLIKASQ